MAKPRAGLSDRAATGAECVAVVVTFNPDLTKLTAALEMLTKQVGHVVIVDNASGCVGSLSKLSTSLNVVSMFQRSNIGVAGAQNVGIERARQLHARTVILLDQDTVLRPDTVSLLHDALETLVATGTAVAAVAPLYRDLNSTDVSGLSRARGMRIRRTGRSGSGIDECDFAIASGTLIPVDTLEAVGTMETGLFIDLVDMEWCFRARQRGYSVFQVEDAVIDHILGEGRVRVFMAEIPSHAPVRNYYWVRNALLLAKRSYVPPAWRLFLISRAVAFLAIYPVFADRRLQRLRCIVLGLWDGILGRSGNASDRVARKPE